MQLIPHVAVGYLIGHYFSSPWLIIGLAIASHYLLDAIPHWDPAYDEENFGVNLHNWGKQTSKVKKQLWFLMVSQTAVVLGFSLLLRHDPNFRNMIIGGFFSMLPDFYEWIGGLLGWPSVHFQKKILKHRHTGWKRGAVIQFITSASTLFPFLKMFLK